MSLSDKQPRYLLGEGTGELDRLKLQDRFFTGPTEQGLMRAGLRPGMRVLDLGCGAGDVTLTAASIVGESGSVLGIDRSAKAVASANARIESHGLASARCIEGDIDKVDLSGFDAIVGRFILMHLREPDAFVVHLCRAAPPGTLLAFFEMDLTSASSTPPLPLFSAGLDAIVTLYRAGGVEPDMGSRLYGTFRGAGLSPTLRAWCHVAGSDDPEPFDFLAETLRSLAPALTEAGLMRAEFDSATYGDTLKANAAEGTYCLQFPRLIGAWARS